MGMLSMPIRRRFQVNREQFQYLVKNFTLIYIPNSDFFGYLFTKSYETKANAINLYHNTNENMERLTI